MRYFFDTRDDSQIIPDFDGVELADMDEVKTLAATSLAELAAEVLPSSWERRLGVDVRDEREQAVLTTELTFKATLRQATA
jgi:hypothetical protein